MADFVPIDRVWETTTVAGTGAATLLGAVGGNQSFAAVGNGNKCLVCISSPTQWEVSESTYTAAGTSLDRGTVLSGSNGTSPVNFAAGTKDVQLVLPGAASTGRGGPVLRIDPEFLLSDSTDPTVPGGVVMSLSADGLTFTLKAMTPGMTIVKNIFNLE